MASLVGAGGAAAVAAQPYVAAVEDDAPQVSGGTLEWGVRESIRNYLEKFGHTEGSVAAYQGASYRTGDAFASFPVKDGTVDIDAGTASISFDGEIEMRGFGDPWLHFEDVRLEVDGQSARIVVDLIESYNVRERSDDVTLAEFDLPSGALQIENDALTLTTGAGRFPDDIGRRHLPSYGGPTYTAPNDRTDPFTLKLRFGANSETPGGETPGGETPGTKDPETGPYGVSLGTPLAGNTSYLRVLPGYAVNADGSTELTVEGHRFNPGPAVAPGTGSGGIYVGFGTMKDASNPEQWRRSKGGASGPVGLGDFTYGLSRFVTHQNSADADVADGAMDADGSWRMTITLPGSEIPSFFGDTIDCVAQQCGFFTFGAHGVVSAANEAFVPVYFEGQDPSKWPARNSDEPVVVPGPGTDPGTNPGTDPGTNPGTNPGEQPGNKGEPSGESTASNDSGAKLTVAPAYALGDAKQTVKLTGTGYPTTATDGSNFGGLYVLFGWVDPTAGKNWGPGSGGSSARTYTYAKDGLPAGTYQRMVNFPGNTSEPSQPFMDANGNWTMDFTIEASRFESAQGRQVDCYTMQCGIITIGAHGKMLGAGEVFTPVYFTDTADGTGNTTPPTAGGGVTTNPNMQAQPAAQTGVGVNGGLAALAATGGQSRELVIAGVLVMSLGLLGAALLHAGRAGRRPRTAGSAT